MAFALTVRLRAGRYDAAATTPTIAEWPPHPARLFCALVASARDERDWQALQWLEAQPPPEVWCSAADSVALAAASGYVVTNAIASRGGNQSWPGRTNNVTLHLSSVPADDTFAVVWTQATAGDERLAVLRELARRVPYLGRTTSPAEVQALDAAPTGRSSWEGHAPTTIGAVGGVHVLRVPYSGYVDDLRAAYADGQRAWEIERSIPYRLRSQTTNGKPRGTAQSPYAELLVWAVPRPSARISGDRVVSLTHRLRQAVISRVPDPVPRQVTGHDADDVPHVAFLALGDVGHAHADGHVIGMALAVPRSMPPADRQRLLQGVSEDPLRLQLGSGGVIDLHPADVTPGVRALLPERWTAGRSGKSAWVTATPLMLDRYLGRRNDHVAAVSDAVERAGYPRPEMVEVSDAPLVAGALSKPRRGSLPSDRPWRPLVHARIQFGQPVVGPVIVGSFRYLGLGICVPEDGS